jgi:hypothetical protein
MTRLKTILNKYKETRMARPKFRLQETYHDFTDAQVASAIKALDDMRQESAGAGVTPSIGDVIKERETTHGDFALKAGFIQEIMENISGLYIWNDLADDQKEAIHMIIAKLSRILYGNPDHADHWIDIAGYAKLVSDRLENKK